MDVNDCIDAMDSVLANSEQGKGFYANKMDKTRLLWFGGSHSGFLGAHIAGQYPDYFKVSRHWRASTEVMPSLMAL